ncbi:MAG: DNA integrity scanning protein DisA [Firmicutes bacterium]|jgi:diadenylate cyclase|nr:DNA integrity scanning protein DisA [Bacillota bacterium]
MPVREDRVSDELFYKTLRMVSPGTPLHEGLESILRARTGALIVIGDSEEVMSLVNGGFRIDAELNPAALYELAKMDGAIILSSDAKRILYANTQLTPNPLIPTVETGTRHRTAERVARQTGALVISISQRRNVITVYKGSFRYMLRDVSVVLAKANQALSTLEKYKAVLQQVLNNLSALEFEDLATLYDVTICIQRSQMVARIVREIERYVAELGTEGRLVNMQLEELLVDVKDQGDLVVKDYYVEGVETPENVLQTLESWSSEELLDLTLIARALGYGAQAANLDAPVTPRGYRMLSKIPRLPATVIENLVQSFKRFPSIDEASITELDQVEGIGEVRAHAIKDGLRRLREHVLLDRHV